jgi:GAF domain-containing protein
MTGSKADKYSLAVKQVESLLDDENDLVANLANVAAVLKTTFGFWWVGFYLVKGNELVLGPFQGPVACTRIGFGKGVCGSSWEQKETIIVPDVHKFPGHIACSSESNSEIVVPVLKNGEVIMVLDIDSTDFGTFDETDKEFLEIIAHRLTQQISF